MTTTKITLDMLDKYGVSILWQDFETDEEGNEIQQVGYNKRISYRNTPSSREFLKEKLPEEKYLELLEVWGDTPTIEDCEPLTPSLEELKVSLIARMSNHCNNAITNGFDLILSDGISHHFSLKVEDQLMIQALMLKVKAGETVLPYHADGESCRYFTQEEVMALYSYMERVITYHTTYFNSLRGYINSIDSGDKLNIAYGDKVPEEYQSEVFKSLLSEGNTDEKPVA